LGKVAKALLRGLVGFLDGLRILWLASFYGMAGDVVGFEWWLKELEGRQKKGAGL